MDLKEAVEVARSELAQFIEEPTGEPYPVEAALAVFLDFAREAAGDLRDWMEVLSDPVRQSDCIEDLDGGITPALVEKARAAGLLD